MLIPVSRVKTEVKHVSTPLNVNLRMQLQKQQLEDQQKRNSFQHQQRSVAQSTAINMPITVQALKSDIPANIVQVSLLYPLIHHYQNNNFISLYVDRSALGSQRLLNCHSGVFSRDCNLNKDINIYTVMGEEYAQVLATTKD